MGLEGRVYLYFTDYSSYKKAIELANSFHNKKLKGYIIGPPKFFGIVRRDLRFRELMKLSKELGSRGKYFSSDKSLSRIMKTYPVGSDIFGVIVVEIW